MSMESSLRLATTTLWKREMVRFFRQRNRITGSLMNPIVFWLLFGWGLSGSFQGAAVAGRTIGSMEYLFPGTIAMIILFTSIFSNFSLIEDRKEGFLQGVLVSPAPRLAIVLGKVLGGASVAILEALLFLSLPFALGLLTEGAFRLTGWEFLHSLTPLADARVGFWTFLLLLPILVVFSVGLTAMGFRLAWGMDSTAGFHAVMMGFLLPMWLLSGAFFPVDKVPAVMRWLMRANPMTYGVDALRQALQLHEVGLVTGLFGLILPSILTVIFAVAMVWASIRVTTKRSEGSLA
ncbi:MAG: ABC transporter permease [Planctomycetes bacterium]|nr:ABC transporter permease [Planctomycetota bacterium]